MVSPGPSFEGEENEAQRGQRWPEVSLQVMTSSGLNFNLLVRVPWSCWLTIILNHDAKQHLQATSHGNPGCGQTLAQVSTIKT